MKKIILLFAITLFFSCNNDDNTDFEPVNGDFLLSSATGSYPYRNSSYNYDSNNKLTSIQYSNTVNTLRTYVYDSSGNLVEINENVSPYSQLDDNENVMFYFSAKIEFIEYSDSSIRYTLSYFDDNGIINSDLSYEVELTIEGNLIKTHKITYSNGESSLLTFTHDSEGRIIERVNEPSSPSANGYLGSRVVYESWDDNAISSVGSGFYIDILPEYYISTKNPFKEESYTLFYTSGNQDFVKSRFEYNYDTDGLVIEKQIFKETEAGNEDFVFQKTDQYNYIPAN